MRRKSATARRGAASNTRSKCWSSGNSTNSEPYRSARQRRAHRESPHPRSRVTGTVAMGRRCRACAQRARGATLAAQRCRLGTCRTPPRDRMSQPRAECQGCDLEPPRAHSLPKGQRNGAALPEQPEPRGHPCCIHRARPGLASCEPRWRRGLRSHASPFALRLTLPEDRPPRPSASEMQKATRRTPTARFPRRARAEVKRACAQRGHYWHPAPWIRSGERRATWASVPE